jgi:hypothetical protein
LKIHRIVVRGLVLGLFGAALFSAAPGRADPTQGLCNSLIAQALGTAMQVSNHGPTVEQCADIGSALAASLAPPCLDLVLANEVGILKAASAPNGEIAKLGVRICTALAECGFTPLPFGLCPGF